MTPQSQRILAAAVEKAWAPREEAHKAEIAKLKQAIAELTKGES
jgi:hypothetical protein